MEVMSDRWDTSGIRRISEDRSLWRVSVETWSERDGYHGRVVFLPDRTPIPAERREGPDALRGPTREDVVAAAHLLPEDQLRQLFRSLA